MAGGTQHMKYQRREIRQPSIFAIHAAIALADSGLESDLHRAKVLRITKMGPFTCCNCFFLKSENERLTVAQVGNPGLLTHLVYTTAQIVARGACPVFTGHG
jgi:hypothetical protein